MYLEEYEEEPYDPLFLPLSEQKNKRRNPWRFLKIVGDVLKLDWLTHKTPEDRESTIQRLIPNFACRALEKDDFLSLQELLSHMDINDATYDGITVLHRVCELGKTDMVLQLLSLGASCNLTDRFGCTPLHLAIKNKHHDVIRLLMLKDATVSQHPVRIAMDLMKAVRDNDDRLLCGWHLAGADMNQQDYNGRTALHTAVEKRNTRMVSKLLEYGATPEIPDVWQRTAVDEAAENDLHEISELFRQMK